MLILLCAGTAAAAPPDRCLSDPVCARQNDEAAKFAEKTQYERALAILEPAYEQFAEPRLLVNIGRCYFRLGRAHKSLVSYQKLQAALPDAEPELLERLKLYISEAQQAIAASSADRKNPEEEAPAPRPAPPSSPTTDPSSVEPPRPPANRCSLDPACQQLHDQGARQAGRTQYEQALGLFERAYERSQEPRLLVNIGRCYFRLGRAGKALDSFYALRRAMPQLEPEIKAQLEPFIADAKQALIAERQLVADEERLIAQRDSEAARHTKEKPLPSRPRWRIALGAALIGAGVVLLGVGGNALAQNGQCVTPSMNAMDLCATTINPDGQRSTLLVDGITPGAPLVTFGGALAIAGVVTVAIP